MKNVVNALIGFSVVAIVVTVISRLMQEPIAGIESRGMAAFTAILLLLAIALSVKK